MHSPLAPRRPHLPLALAALLAATVAVGQGTSPPADPTSLLLADEPLYRAFDRIGARYGVHVYYHPDDVPFYTTSLAQGERSLFEVLQAATQGTNLRAVKYDADTYVVAPEGRQSRAYADEVVAGWRSGRYRSLDDRVRPAITADITRDTLLRGRVRDAETEEPLFGATVFDPLRAAGTSTDLDGAFALPLPADATHRLEIRLLGYELQPLVVTVAAGAGVGNGVGAEAGAGTGEDTTAAPLALALHPQVTGLEEVVVTARDGQRLQREAAGGVRAVSLRELRALPALTGDLDVLQALTVTAGVGQAAEGSAGITVRGGGLDQNLILQGGMPVLYPAHALGFFPVFHPDLVAGVDLYRGYVPPSFGGRAASVVDVAWRTGDMQRWRAKGAAGPFASRLAVEGPLVRERVSLLVGGRASHLNWALDRVRNRDVRTSSVAFADASAQVTGRWTGGKVDVQGAYATDDFTYAARSGYRYTNASARVAVNQRLADGWLGRVEASRSRFADEQVELRTVPGPSTFTTGLTLDRARAAVRYERAGTRGDGGEAGALALEGGVELGSYATPTRARVPELGSLAAGFAFRDPSLRNAAAYVQARFAPSARTVVEGGVRVSVAESRRAPGVRYRYDGPAALGQVRETGFSDSETAHRLPAQLEPRVSVTHDLTGALTLGVAYSRLVQPVSQLTPTVTPTPTDVFLVASEHLALITSQAVSATLASRPSRGERSLGAELAGYYRRIRNNHLAREGAGLRASDAPERSVYTAPGTAYGGELTRAFVSAVESLGPGTLTLTGVVAARRRLGLGGDSVLNGDAGMRVAFDVPAGGTEGLLVFTPGAVDYSLSERFCGGLDPTLNCYFTEAPRQPSLAILPLDGLAGGSPYRGLVGSELVDYRFAQLAYYTVAYERLGAAALPYYRSLATSLAAGGSFFAERPLTLPGNVSMVEGGADEDASTEVLGYFAVRERGFLRGAARGDDIDALAPRPPCSLYGLGVPGLDCCNCFSLPGASVTPPAWWPE